jgi:hypothetical protein
MIISELVHVIITYIYTFIKVTRFEIVNDFT